MELALKLASIFFTMILVDNYVLAKFLGICPFLGVSKKLDSAVGMSLAVTFVMVLATAATWPIQMFLLTPPGSEGTARDLGYLQTIVFILIIAILVQLLENILKKFIPALYKSLGEMCIRDRFLGTMNEGVSFAILLMNLLVPYIEILTRQDRLGIAKTKKKEGAAK